MACALVKLGPKTIHSMALAGDADVRERQRRLAAERRSLGYRRLGIALERGGASKTKKTLMRLKQGQGLAVRQRQDCKRVTDFDGATGQPEP